jgi:hypothetical protein
MIGSGQSLFGIILLAKTGKNLVSYLAKLGQSFLRPAAARVRKVRAKKKR